VPSLDHGHSSVVNSSRLKAESSKQKPLSLELKRGLA
jgi:hypothetical protein